MPIAMIAAMGGMSALYLTSGAGAPRSPMFLFFPAMMAVSLIATLAYGSRAAGRSTEVNARRAEYLCYLDTVRAGLTSAAADQHRYLHWAHPHPEALWTLTGGERMWERRADHPDFCSVRIGVGEAPAAVEVLAPALGPEDTGDPVTTGAVRELMGQHSVVAEVPVLLALRSVRLVTLNGDPDAARACARALVCQLATLHGPHLVSVTVRTVAKDVWDWLKWLPHVKDTERAAHRVLIVDGAPRPEPDAGSTIVELNPEEPGAAVTVDVDGQACRVDCDTLGLPEALACARRVARRAGATGSGCATRAPDWLALMSIDKPEALTAGPALRGCELRVPIGVTDGGDVVELDIKEAAAGGMGPHGLCIGATGSGKSELLRTLTLGMIAAHSPEALNLVLVDFKGGATFLGMEAARHVSAVITNLADQAPLVARMREALSGELNRRQELLRSAGNLTNVSQYRDARLRDRSLPVLPALFIVVDEFSELLSRHPEFVDVFGAIGRLGRSLGMHLLLASQRLDEGRLRGLETHLSYRICLKTFSAGESRAVLGVPDAYQLPPRPGAAYLKTADAELTRLQTAFVSGEYLAARRAASTAVRPFTLECAATADAAPRRGGPAPTTQPLLNAVLDALPGHGPAAHRVWLPPLTVSPALHQLLATVPAAHLRVPVGLVDCPYEQRHEPLIVDLAGAAGNVAVVGAPRSGKSTTLQTLVCALAGVHDPSAVQFYCLDFGGGALAALTALPHVGSVAARVDADLCRRTVAVLESILRKRESAFSDLGAGSFPEYRRLREADPAAVDDPYGEVFLLIDGWAALRQEFEGLDAAVSALAAQGLSYGVHVVIAASRWADIRPALKDQIGTRIELRLGDPADSEMDRRSARSLADHPPGHGLTRDGRQMVVALPELDTVRPDGPAAPPIELLPARVPYSPGAAGDRHPPGHVVLGVGERDLTSVAVDFGEHPHLLVLGDGECGKTALLRLLCCELMRRYSPAQAQLELVDYRRTMLGVVETGHLAGYSVSGTTVAARMAALSEQLSARMPGEHVTQRQLRDRSWWAGPDIYVIVDDYDLVAGATGNPLTPLADFLPHARDLGLHVIVARRSGGAARALFDPVLARLRDMGSSGLMMSARPDEGVLLGTARPVPLPTGRGTLLVRGRPDELVQIGWVEPQ